MSAPEIVVDGRTWYSHGVAEFQDAPPPECATVFRYGRGWAARPRHGEAVEFFERVEDAIRWCHEQDAAAPPSNERRQEP